MPQMHTQMAECFDQYHITQLSYIDMCVRVSLHELEQPDAEATTACCGESNVPTNTPPHCKELESKTKTTVLS